MELTEKYKLEQEDVIRRGFEARNIYINSARFMLLKAFCEGFSTILSVGCGSYEPLIIKATHACDVSFLSLEFLRSQGWKGVFLECSCDNLPFSPLSFDVAVCSEVIEHLPDLESVGKTFLELNRVAHNWILTTPCNPLGPKNPERTHKFAFSLEQLKEFTKDLNVKIFKDDLHYYVIKKEDGTLPEIFNRYFAQAR